MGTDFLSHVLWDKYIKFEVEQGAFANVARIYLQILSGPLRELPRYHSRCPNSWLLIKKGCECQRLVESLARVSLIC